MLSIPLSWVIELPPFAVSQWVTSREQRMRAESAPVNENRPASRLLEITSAPGFAEQCMAEYDLDGWTVPDLINPER
jgi:hypothetical protein